MRVVLQLTATPASTARTLTFAVNGERVQVEDDGASLLEVLRERLGYRSVKDGCSPQGQCGCCTVWVDGAPRVACVTPARRVAGREVTTLEGLDPGVRDTWATAFAQTGASQCGFCTPGIVMRLAALDARRGALDDTAVKNALLAHLCRCTGWRTILDAARRVADGSEDGSGCAGAPPRDATRARQRAALEGGTPQDTGPQIALGAGGFADDTAPAGALVAVPDGHGGYCLGASPAEARGRTGRVQGRNTTLAVAPPLDLPQGTWALTLRTAFVEPAYLELDASWCEPGGAPASPLANGGAFGGKVSSPVGDVARRLADEHGVPVRVLFSREDAVRLGPKRPPLAAGLREDASGVLRVARTPGSEDLAPWAEQVRRVLPAVDVEEVEVPGPPVSARLRGGGWVEAAVLAAALDARRRNAPATGWPVTVTSPAGARATAVVHGDEGDEGDETVSVHLAAGEVLDETVLRSYVIGAAHQALGWVRSEGIAVADDGEVRDLTIRSFGILAARDMPPVEVVLEEEDRAPVQGSDAVLAAVAAAAWLAGGLSQDWPLGSGRQHHRGSR